MKHQEYNSAFNILYGNSVAQKNKYNGKEFQDELELNFYDYGWRNYDSTLGRWFNIDPLAEHHFKNSPFVYVNNNPIIYVDPDGRDFTLYGTDAQNFVASLQSALALVDEVGGYVNIDADTSDINIFGGGGETILPVLEWTVGLSGTGWSFGGGFGSAVQHHVYAHSPFYGYLNIGEDSGWLDWERINTGIGAFGIGNGVKTGLIEYAGKTGELTKGTTNYLKFFKGAGVAGGMVSSTISISNAYNYYSNGGQASAVFVKTTLDTVMTGVGFLGPIGLGISAAYFILTKQRMTWRVWQHE